MKFRTLRLFLGFAGCVWGVSVYGVFSSWEAAEEALRGLGAEEIRYDRMLDYWLRMAAGAFSLVGAWYFLLMARVAKFWAAIPWFGGLMVAEGLILAGLGCGYRCRRFRSLRMWRRVFWAGWGFYIFGGALGHERARG